MRPTCRTAIRLALGCVATASCCAPAIGQTDLEGRLGLDLMWIDNLTLAPPGQPKEEEYQAQVIPGFRLTHDTRRVQTYLDYEAQALFHADNDDQDQVFHQASASADLEAVQDWFFVDVNGSYFQSVVDPNQPVNRNNLFSVGNVADTAAASITPALRHRFSWAQLDAAYTRGIVDYRDSITGRGQLDDSDNEVVDVSLGSPDAEALVTWGLRYNHQRAEYDVAEPFEYERGDAEIGIRIGPEFRLIGRGGAESDPFRASDEAGLDESFWQAGFAWRRGDRAELRALVGERFFGTSYEVLLQMTGRVLQFEAGYNEEPTTQAQRTALRDVQAPQDVFEVPPDDATIGRVTSDVYLSKRLRGELRATGRYTNIGVDVLAENREYLNTGRADDKFRTGRVFLSRQFGQRTEAQLNASLTDADLFEGSEYKDRLYGVSVARRIGMRTTVTLAGNHLERSGDTVEYDANYVSLGIGMTF